MPAWLTGLKGLRKLDISMNPAIQVDNVTLLTQLDTLVMQVRGVQCWCPLQSTKHCRLGLDCLVLCALMP